MKTNDEDDKEKSYIRENDLFVSIFGITVVLSLQDLQTYAGPNAEQEWRKLLVSISFFLLIFDKLLEVQR